MRHGNTFESHETAIQIGARTDLPLTSFGLTQAEAMAKYLLTKKITPKAIFSGPLKRQLQSAQIIAKYFYLEPIITPSLTELDYGVWEGLTPVQISEKWPSEYASWNESSIWPKGLFNTSKTAHETALSSWLESLKKSFTQDDTVLAVTSNGLLRFFHPQEKVKTGHFCTLLNLPNQLIINSWNTLPKVP